MSNGQTNHVAVTRLQDGSLILRPTRQLGKYFNSIAGMFVEAAQRNPERPFLVERDHKDQWQVLTYGEARQRVQSIAQALLDRGCATGQPVMILSGNSTEHALITLAAIHIGVPVAPISPAYSLVSSDFVKLRHVYDLLKPALIFVQSTHIFKSALNALNPENVEIIAVENREDDITGIDWDALTETRPTVAAEEACAKVNPDTVVKYLFSSGSTGMPKAVINTHRMLCSNQQALVRIYPFLLDEPPTIVDWLPWNHTFGGNHNFNLVLRTGGTLYIDKGKPVPGFMEESIRNLEDVSPSIYFNVPAGFDMLTQHLERSEALRENFFHKLKLIYYAAAALPQPVFDKLNELSVRTLGRQVRITTGYGSTETSPLATAPVIPLHRSSGIGIPIPGSELKLARVGGKLEIRLKGPHITPGYLNEPEKTKKAFDDEGYFRMGDAAQLVNEKRPDEGLEFDGRITEDFKLMNGSWVSVGNVRVAVINAAAPLIKDLVITGHNQNHLGALIWINPGVCRDLYGLHDAGDESLARNKQVIEQLATRIKKYNSGNKASTVRITRAILMQAPPSIDKNEITDKGYINQSAVLNNRREAVEKLYSTDIGPDVLVF